MQYELDPPYKTFYCVCAFPRVKVRWGGVTDLHVMWSTLSVPHPYTSLCASHLRSTNIYAVYRKRWTYWKVANVASWEMKCFEVSDLVVNGYFKYF